MEDNVIKVSVRPNKQNSVKVSSNVVSTPITANSDTSQLWSQVSKNWAVSEQIVDNTDYSSKYYANKAKENATTAQGISEAVKSDYNEFITASLNANEQLQTGKEEALTSLESARADAENSINNTKTTAISDIEFVADGEKKEIEYLAENAKDDIKSTGFYMRDDKLYFINSKGEEEEFKSGVEPESLEQFVKKESLVEAHVVIETYVNGTSWYRVWSDGFIEQGGIFKPSNTWTNLTLNLLKYFSNTNYQIMFSIGDTTGNSLGLTTCLVVSKATQSLVYSVGGFNNSIPASQLTVYWYACGY